MYKANKLEKTFRTHGRGASGFTLVEVIVAGSLMVVLCVGVLSVFSFAVRINAGNNLRAQALTVLQKKAEYYRSLKFVPNQVISDPALHATGGPVSAGQDVSQDGTQFDLQIQITNLSSLNGNLADESSVTLKQIDVVATPTITRQGWLANLKTNLSFLRVRSN